jgi:hypothetical protein
MNKFFIRTANGTRPWMADNKEHAIEQHDDMFKTDGRYDEGEHIEDVYPEGASVSQFKPGDRFFTHYDMKWGTVVKAKETRRGDVHGVTGSKLPDTTWYEGRYDDGSPSLLDDAHGNWDMARMLPPHIAKRYGYGDDPRAAELAAERASLLEESRDVEEGRRERQDFYRNRDYRDY